MDAVHGEFEALVAKARDCADPDFQADLERLAAHLREHFEAEDRWMRETCFPARECHIDEHAAVLRSVDEVMPAVAFGNTDLGRAFVAELQRWFPAHADYLDSALAAWMCKRQYGGKPVVLHRHPPVAS
jgi:hemerythrin-like metal-binding protein